MMDSAWPNPMRHFPDPLRLFPAPRSIRACAIVTPAQPLLGFFELVLIDAPTQADLFRPVDAEFKFAAVQGIDEEALFALRGRFDFYTVNVKTSDPDPSAPREYAHWFADDLEFVGGALTHIDGFLEGEFNARLNVPEPGVSCFNWYGETVDEATFKRTFS